MKKSLIALAALCAAALSFSVAAQAPPVGPGISGGGSYCSKSCELNVAADLGKASAATPDQGAKHQVTKADVCRLHVQFPNVALLERACHFGPQVYPAAVSLRSPRDSEWLRAPGGGSNSALYRT